MPETTQLKRPNGRRLAVIGGCGVASGLLWIAAGILAVFVESREVPRVIFTLVACAAIAITISTVILAASYASQQAAADNHAVILTAAGHLAAQQEQLSEKISKINVNPWEIYSAAAADILGDQRRQT